MNDGQDASHLLNFASISRAVSSVQQLKSWILLYLVHDWYHIQTKRERLTDDGSLKSVHLLRVTCCDSSMAPLLLRCSLARLTFSPSSPPRREEHVLCKDSNAQRLVWDTRCVCRIRLRVLREGNVLRIHCLLFRKQTMHSWMRLSNRRPSRAPEAFGGPRSSHDKRAICQVYTGCISPHQRVYLRSAIQVSTHETCVSAGAQRLPCQQRCTNAAKGRGEILLHRRETAR